MPWSAEAPANIALIKYMGKRHTQSNEPCNASLSYTLNHLHTQVRLISCDASHDSWEPMPNTAWPLSLSTDAIQRFLNHLQFIKHQFNYNGSFTVQSMNNFPHSTGLASSASSFAALTRCAVLACAELTHSAVPDQATQATWSRHGSGSSCRSFFAPWALWDHEQVQSITLPYTNLLHQVIVLETNAKKRTLQSCSSTGTQ